MRRTLDLRLNPPETGGSLNNMEDRSSAGGPKGLKEKYEEAKKLNEFFKDQVKCKLL